MRLLSCDAWYPEAFARARAIGCNDHESLQEFSHGTSSYWDIAFRSKGHEAETIINNEHPNFSAVAEAGRKFAPDVVISRNIGLWPAPLLRAEFPNAVIVGMCSYRTNDENLRGFDVIFSSFPWMPEYCKAIGANCEYLPLAFGRPVLRRLGDQMILRHIPVAFVGGLGDRHWRQATTTLAKIAESIPEFQWWGYKIGPLPTSLEKTYQGEAWGLDYFRLLHQIKILVNRHGEIAKGFANNTRVYEGRGCGCFVIDDCPGECKTGICIDGIGEGADAACMAVEYWMMHGYEVEQLAHESQMDILKNHCYENRVDRFLEIVEGLRAAR